MRTHEAAVGRVGSTVTGDDVRTSAGKRSLTQGGRSSTGAINAPAKIEHASALVTTLRDQLLPRLRSSIVQGNDELSLDTARDVRRDLAELDREIRDLERAGTGTEERIETERLAAQRDELRAESDSLLAAAPRRAPALTPDEPVLIAHDSVQRYASGASGDDSATPRIAAQGVAGGGGRLPHLEAIQRSFGPHDVSGIESHVGGAAAAAAGAIGAEAYATGNKVAFASQPSLFVAAHEAAHVVQQRAGVQLLGGVGQVGDPYEQNADAVAERVVRGESAVDLLGAVRDSTAGTGTVQRQAGPKDAVDASGLRTTVTSLAPQVDATMQVLESLEGNDAAESIAEGLRTLATALRKHSKALHQVAQLVLDPSEREELTDIAAYGEGSAAAALTASTKVIRHHQAAHAGDSARTLEEAIEQLTAAGDQLDIARQATNTSAMRGWVRTLRVVAGRTRTRAQALANTIDSLGKDAPKEAKAWRDVIARAETAVDAAMTRADTAENQATSLEEVRGSDMGKLAASAPDSAQSLEERANAIVPDGICDDPTMQGGQACSLDASKRSDLRQEAFERLAAVGNNWSDAVGALDIDLAIASRAINPLLDMLITVLLAEFGGAALRAAQGASTAVGTMRNKRWDAADAANFYQVDIGKRPWDGKFPVQVKGTINGLMSALARTARKRITFDPSNGEKRDFVPALHSFARDWAQNGRALVRALPDEELVALNEALSSHVMDVAFFEPKVAEVMHRFEEQVLSINDNYYWTVDQSVAKIEHPNGTVSYALVRRETKTKLALGIKEYDVKPTGRYTFLRWIDKDLESEAMSQQGADRIIELRPDDHRWVNTDALDPWLQDPGAFRGPSSWIVEENEDRP